MSMTNSNIWRPKSREEAKDFMVKGTHEVAKFAVQHYGIDPELLKHFKVRVARPKLRTKKGKKSKQTSWAGWRGLGPKINYVVRLWPSYADTVRFNEYQWFRLDKEIGPIHYATWVQYYTALICHEVAHIIADVLNGDNFAAEQYYCDDPFVELFNMKEDVRVDPDYRPDAWEGHGTVWQGVYRALRNNFVNGKPGLNLRPNITKREKKEKEVIGFVEIDYGTCLYRNNWFRSGTFSLIKGYQKHGGNRPWRKVGTGFITIQFGGRQYRVNVFENRGYKRITK